MAITHHISKKVEKVGYRAATAQKVFITMIIMLGQSLKCYWRGSTSSGLHRCPLCSPQSTLGNHGSVHFQSPSSKHVNSPRSTISIIQRRYLVKPQKLFKSELTVNALWKSSWMTSRTLQLSSAQIVMLKERMLIMNYPTRKWLSILSLVSSSSYLPSGIVFYIFFAGRGSIVIIYNYFAGKL